MPDVATLQQFLAGGQVDTRYSGAPRLIRATGGGPFDTVADGVVVTEHPDPGEVVWCDDAGVTCRRWNWRQARRTQLTAARHSAPTPRHCATCRRPVNRPGWA